MRRRQVGDGTTVAIQVRMYLATAWNELAPRHTDVIFVRADPNGLAYDRERDAVVLADARSGAVLRLDGSRCERLARVDVIRRARRDMLRRAQRVHRTWHCRSRRLYRPNRCVLRSMVP